MTQVNKVSTYQVLTNCLKYLNKEGILDTSNAGAHFLYRLRYVNSGVQIESFLAMSDGVAVEARLDIKDDCFWIAKRAVALEDVSKVEDKNELIRLHAPCRAMAYETFFIHDNSPIVSMRLHGELVRSFETDDVGMVITTSDNNRPTAKVDSKEKNHQQCITILPMSGNEVDNLLSKFSV